MNENELYRAILSYDHSQTHLAYIQYINNLILRHYDFSESILFKRSEDQFKVVSASIELNSEDLDFLHFPAFDILQEEVRDNDISLIKGSLFTKILNYIDKYSYFDLISNSYDKIVLINLDDNTLKGFNLFFIKESQEINKNILEQLGYISSFLKLLFINYCIEEQEKKNISLLKRQQEELNIIFNSVPATIFYKDKETRLIRVNDAYVEKIGLSRDEIYMKKDIEIFPIEDAEKYKLDDEKVINQGITLKNIIEKVETSHGTLWLRTDKIPYRDLDGKIQGLIGFSIDITENKEVEEKLKQANKELRESNDKLLETYEELSASEEELRKQNEEILKSRQKLSASEEKYKLLVENSEDLIYNLDKYGNIISVNKRFEEVFALSREELVGKNMSTVIVDKNFYEKWLDSFNKVLDKGETIKDVYDYHDKYGNKVIYDITLLPVINNGQISNIIGTNHDISELVAKERKIKKLAYYDEVTGIHNRTYFKEKAIELLDSSSYLNNKLAFFFIDLDNFKKVNDNQGHKIGDMVLKKMANRFKKVFNNAILLARMGGDEFAVLLKLENNIGLKNIAKRALDIIKEPCEINGLVYHLSCSIGIAIFPDHGENFESLLQYSDTAMYQAKEANKNTFKIFNKRMMKESEKKLQLETQIRYALQRGEMGIHYQPIVKTGSGEIIGFEALMRWNSIIFDKVPPSTFIPILEETGLIIPYGEWIMLNACQQIKLWQEKFSKEFFISVNVSPIQLKQKDFVENLKANLNKCNLKVEHLEIEITESIFIEDIYNVINKLKELQEIGIKIALDDFGTGYSSLNYLRSLPINKLKIDKLFVKEIDKEDNKFSVIGSMISLAHDMQLEVVAEGVETEAQKSFLESKNCDYQQGYYYFRPIGAEDISKILIQP